MVQFWDELDRIVGIIPIARTIIIVILLLAVFTVLLRFLRKKLLKRARTRRQSSNISILLKIINYGVFAILILAAIFSYTGSWTGFGIAVGLLTAALGWALQKPITGIAAWIMLVVKRPFNIGDRIIIGGVKGDVVDMTLTHLYIYEVGGIVEGEESSGRIIMIPNASLFEQNIVNYTFHNEYVLDQVTVTVTHQSNIDKAIRISLESAKKFVGEFHPATKQEPYVRTFFQQSGISVHVRYFSPAHKLQEFSSKVTKEIHSRIMKAKDVDIAYPHTAVILRKNVNMSKSPEVSYSG